MSLVINHNLMAMNAARNLNTIYNRLATSTQRLSSGLRINSAADDAAGLAIRELMRADIAVFQQGIRNASDGISMIQTAEGAMAVIDEKITRMKELAEQASTGTYTTVQREIMNSEYQAMANEIDRIANATEFNGIKLLDGSLSDIHGGSGLKVHFGTGNSATEDYYFIHLGDVRATTRSGLQIGGDAKNDVWAQGGIGGAGGPAGQCCGVGLESLDEAMAGESGNVFAFGYNHDLSQDVDSNLVNPSYLAGVYEVESGNTLREFVNEVNMGTQSRVRINFTSSAISAGMLTSGTNGAFRICLGDEVYFWGSSANALAGISSADYELYQISNYSTAASAAIGLHEAITSGSTSFWSYQVSNSALVIFNRKGGDNDDMIACDDALGSSAINDRENYITWQNMENWETDSAGTTFGNGGEDWGRLTPVATQFGTWSVTLDGRDVGDERDLWIANVGSVANADIPFFQSIGTAGQSITGFRREDFTEIQNAAWGDWDGSEIRTQSSAQEALDAIQLAIEQKDKIRASLGAFQNRLENTITNLSIMSENLQASESRISDIDVATEMTEFTKNNILAQAATAMLSQANSLPQLALSLLG